MAEKKPIIKIYFTKPKEAWFGLSEEKQKELLDKTSKNLEQVGGRNIAFGTSCWSDEEWTYFGVQEYPDIQAVQEHAQFMLEEDGWRYFESKSHLGTRTQ